MNAVVHFLILLVVLSAAAFILFLLRAPFWLILLVIVAVYMAVTTVPTFHTVYKSQNLRAIDRFLLRNYRKPIFNYAYNIGHGTDEEIRNSLRTIIDKSSRGDARHVYSALLGVHSGDGDEVLAHAGKINPGPLRSYYYAYGTALNGDLDEAGRIAGKITDEWMKHTIYAVIAKKQGNPEEFRKEAKYAEDASVGIQHYLLHHNFRKMAESFNLSQEGSSMMQLVENTAVELKDGRRGLILGVRDNEEIVQYDVELGDGEIITVFAEEVRRPV